MIKSGAFIVIEGTDGSGKETQQRCLDNRFKQNGINVTLVDFPQYKDSIFGEMVGKFLSGRYGDINNIHPELASLIFAADRYKAKEKIEIARERGDVVIANRYVLANMAHQSARLPKEERRDFIEHIAQMEYTQEGFNLPKPDLNIVLAVEPETARELIKTKLERSYLGKGVAFDQLEADLNHQMEAYNMYRELADILPGVVLIECCDKEGKIMDIETIHEKIWEVSYPLLAEFREGKITHEREE